MTQLDFFILDWIQTHLRCGFLDAVMPKITALGEAGIVWIVLAVVLLAIPKTRKLGAAIAVALILDLLLCNILIKPLVHRPRPFHLRPEIKLLIAPPGEFSFPVGTHGSLLRSGGGAALLQEPRLDSGDAAGAGHRSFPAVPVRPLSHGCIGRNSAGTFLRRGGCFLCKNCLQLLQKAEKLKGLLHLRAKQGKTYKSSAKTDENSVKMAQPAA